MTEKQSKIGILSYRSQNKRATPEELRLKKAAREMGHVSRIFRASRFQMVYDQESPWLLYDGKQYPKYDVIITRPSILRNVDLHIGLIEQMELMGTLLFNRYESILKTKNKIKTMQILEEAKKEYAQKKQEGYNREQAFQDLR